MKSNALALTAVFALSCSTPVAEAPEETPTAPSAPIVETAHATQAPSAAMAPPTAVSSSAPSAAPTSEGTPFAPDERIVAKSGRVAFTHQGELWVTDDKGANARRLVTPKGLTLQNADANLPALDSSDIASLSFSPDEKRIYFMETGWATSMALFYAEVDTAKIYFFHDANSYTVIGDCRDKKQVGRVITFEHSYFDINPMSATDYFFLVDSAAPQPKEERTGRSGRSGIIGPDQSNVDRFLAKTCGIGKAPPQKSPKIPANLSARPIQCGNLKLKRDDLALLDGTSVVRFSSAESGEIQSLEDAIELCKP